MIKIIENEVVKLKRETHVLCLLPAEETSAFLAEELRERVRQLLKRKNGKWAELTKAPMAGDLPEGGRAVWLACPEGKSAFERQSLLAKAARLLLEEKPRRLAVVAGAEQAQWLQDALYVLQVNAAVLPASKRENEKASLREIAVYGAPVDNAAWADALAQGNTLTRSLTAMPANQLTPLLYRQRIRELAKEQGWEVEEYDLKQLRKMGAGAFVAVAQGSQDDGAAIVKVTRKGKKGAAKVGLVGKGICFDTGGHNLKPARYMHGMHEDMNGSAVVLGIMLAADLAGLPQQLTGWLALAENHISPAAYKQNEVVKALNGDTIEIVHTDAEGRMVLADTLTLASRARPDVLVDFATLTGSCITALGNRYCGVFGNDEDWLARAVKAGKESGERLCAFPFDSDYDAALESKVADVKQCTLDGDADHILAARFLSRFVEKKVPWLHVDLAASRNDGGLGALTTDLTGFGVAWCMRLLA